MLILVSISHSPCNGFKLDPDTLCPPIINTKQFFAKMDTFKKNLLSLDTVDIASGSEIKSKSGKMETKILPVSPSSEFSTNPCEYNSMATNFYSPKDFSDISVALDQINATEPVIFKIIYDNITDTFSNSNGNIVISNPDIILDPVSDENRQRYGCIYPDDSYIVCKKDFQPTLALCSQQAQPNREQRRLSNKLDTLVLQGEESIISLIDRVKKVEKNKSGQPVTEKSDTILTPKDERAPDCLPLVINFTPDVPTKFSDDLISADEYASLVQYIRQMSKFLEILKKNIVSLETDHYVHDVKLARPVLDAATYVAKLFESQTLMFTVPAALFALLVLCGCNIGLIRCLRPRIQAQNQASTLHTLALTTEHRPMLQPPEYNSGTV